MSSPTDAPQRGATVDVATAEAGRYLTFTLNGDAYALDIFHVTEILEHRQLTVVPRTPEFIRGVINLRGRAVPVVNLAIRFGRGATTIAHRTSIIIVHISHADDRSDTAVSVGEPDTMAPDGQDIGILVDAVNKVVSFSADDIEPPPAFGTGIQSDFISGMAKRDNDFIIVLDIDQVLSLNDLADLDPVTQDTAGCVTTITTDS